MFDDPSGRFQILSEEYSRTFSKFERAEYSLDVLMPEERVYLLVYMTDSAINSGGIYSLWFNSHGLLDTPEVVESFRTVGAQKRAKVIDRFIRIVHDIPAEPDIADRTEQMDILSVVWPDDDELSEMYYNCDDDMDDILIAFLTKNKHNKPRHPTTTSRSPAMIFRNYNLNPVIAFRPSW